MILIKPLDPPPPKASLGKCSAPTMWNCVSVIYHLSAPEARHVLVVPRVTGAEGEWVTWISTGHSHPLLLTVGQLTDISKELLAEGNGKISVTD